MSDSPGFFENSSDDFAVPGPITRLKAYQYCNGFCVSALSRDEARDYIHSLLPWSWTAYDDVLLAELPDSALDQKWHYEGDLEGKEFSLSFREEIAAREALGEMEPDTFYDKMCLIPTKPIYTEHGWSLASECGPVDERFYWTAGGGSIRKAARKWLPPTDARAAGWQWYSEDGSRLLVSYWHCSDTASADFATPPAF